MGPGKYPNTKRERPRVATSVETWYSYETNLIVGLKIEDVKEAHTG
jgi:hypothetical protein